MAKNELSFEDALKRLEGIAREIEEGKIGLEESITRYEEGMKLVKQCRDILARAEQKIQKLQPTSSGHLEAGPFETPDESNSDETDDEPHRSSAG
jgi:exodeoxyribonuclease VII small subunit